MTHALPSRRSRTPRLATLAPLLLLVAVLVPCTPAEAGTGPSGVWPLQPRPEVVDRFDAPDTRWGPGHRGVDLRGTVGQAVHAAEAGTVTFAGRIAGRGVVVVDHGAARTTYEPVVPSVSVGDAVTAGTVVGRLSLAGSHCFPAACLHWGLIEGGSAYRDPLTLVGGGPVRLLPLTGPLPGAPSLLDGWLTGTTSHAGHHEDTDLTDLTGLTGPTSSPRHLAMGTAAAFRRPLP